MFTDIKGAFEKCQSAVFISTSGVKHGQWLDVYKDTEKSSSFHGPLK